MNRRELLFGATALAAPFDLRPSKRVDGGIPIGPPATPKRPKSANIKTASNVSLPFADGQTVVIDGKECFLSDIIAPSPSPLGRRPEPMADYARAVLAEATSTGSAIPTQHGTTDRWGRIAGQLAWRMATGRESTLQEILVGHGAARVYPQSDDLEALRRLFRFEDRARQARLGLWGHSFYRVREAATAEWSSGFQIYGGAITQAAAFGSRVYFNFGADYKTDFTATVPKGAFGRWKSPVDVAQLAGRIAEVRGFVESINGPSVELGHEMQIRFL